MKSALSDVQDTAISTLTRAEKAVLLLMALGKSRTSILLNQLTADEKKALKEAATGMQPVSGSDFDHLVEEFSQDVETHGAYFAAANGFDEFLDGAVEGEITVNALSFDEANQVGPQTVWSQLEGRAASAMELMLEMERPQVIAFIMTRISPAASSRHLSKLEPEQRNDILRRMLGFERASPRALAAAEQAIAEQIEAFEDKSEEKSATPHEVIAHILNHMDKAPVDAALGTMAVASPADVEKIRRMLFSFEDFPSLSLQARAKILDQIPMEQLVMALRGAEPDLCTAAMSALGARARRIVEMELSNAVQVPPTEIAAARRRIIEEVLSRLASGEITLPR